MPVIFFKAYMNGKVFTLSIASMVDSTAAVVSVTKLYITGENVCVRFLHPLGGRAAHSRHVPALHGRRGETDPPLAQRVSTAAVLMRRVAVWRIG